MERARESTTTQFFYLGPKPACQKLKTGTFRVPAGTTQNAVWPFESGLEMRLHPASLFQDKRALLY